MEKKDEMNYALCIGTVRRNGKGVITVDQKDMSMSFSLLSESPFDKKVIEGDFGPLRAEYDRWAISVKDKESEAKAELLVDVMVVANEIVDALFVVGKLHENINAVIQIHAIMTPIAEHSDPEIQAILKWIQSNLGHRRKRKDVLAKSLGICFSFFMTSLKEAPVQPIPFRDYWESLSKQRNQLGKSNEDEENERFLEYRVEWRKRDGTVSPSNFTGTLTMDIDKNIYALSYGIFTPCLVDGKKDDIESVYNRFVYVCLQEFNLRKRENQIDRDDVVSSSRWSSEIEKIWKERRYWFSRLIDKSPEYRRYNEVEIFVTGGDEIEISLGIGMID